MSSIKEITKKGLKSAARKFLPLIATSYVLVPSNSNANEVKHLEWDWNYISFESSPVVRVRNIPLEIRDVPKHSDDWYAPNKNVAPLSKDDLKLYDHVPLELRFGRRLPISERVRAIIGLGASMKLDTSNPFRDFHEKRNIVERNYTNNPGSSERGYGAALTYYKVGTDFFRIAPFSEVEFSFNSSLSVAVGGRIFEDHLKAENGWDRYDHLDAREKYRLADLVMGEAYFSFRMHTEKDKSFAWALEGGTQHFVKREVVGLGKQTDITFKDNPFMLRVRFIMQ